MAECGEAWRVHTEQVLTAKLDASTSGILAANT